MFRDESNKVIQKAHAQWGTVVSPDRSQLSSAASASSSASWTSSPLTSSGTDSPALSAAVVLSRNMELLSPRMQSKVEPTMEQRGLEFFIEHYLMKGPDAPQASHQLDVYSGSSNAMQTAMIAVGLAGLSNKSGDRAMNLIARQKYTTALKQTGQLIALGSHDALTTISPLRAVVTLALFEVVQGNGSKLSTGTANIHIFGAIALLRNMLPSTKMPADGARGLLQLMFSLFIPAQVSDTPLPQTFFEALILSKQMLPTADHCTCDLAVAIARLIQILAISKDKTLFDGHPNTDKVFQQLQGMDAMLDGLEKRLQISSPWTAEKAARDLPSDAVFRGKYHKYVEIEGARIWNHLRWARILAVQRIIDMSNDFPLSYFRILSPTQRKESFTVSRRMAEDIIVSAPSHWHHPILSHEQAKKMAAYSKGGAGAVGIPGLLWHLKIAACAPGVPQEFWDWSYKTTQVVWKTMGMQHALALSEVMEGHRAGMEKEAINRILKIEDEDA
ncbi:hypothetical protein BJ170DRAFT_98432 [Xylariales sp. AK1849]|nr:hypothetical protein BJ170DRAFT_98432 [Xylariales sp. AK1849]